MNENDADELDKLSMNILVHAGNARNYMVEGLNELAKKWDYQAARDLMKKANDEVVIAHGLQTSTLQLEAVGRQVRYSTLFNHAQDTLMTAQSEILIAQQLIALFASRDHEDIS